MFDWVEPLLQYLSSLPLWAQLVIIVILLSVVVPSLRFIFTEESLQSRLLRLMGKQPPSPHWACRYRDDAPTLADAEGSYTMHKTAGKIAVIKDCLDFTEDILDTMIGEFESRYIDLLKSKLCHMSVTQTRDYKEFRMLMRIFKEEMITRARRIFRNNGFNKMKPKDFDKKVTSLMMTASSVFDDYYCGDIVKREEMYTSNESYLGEVKRLITLCLDHGKEVYEEYYKELSEKEAIKNRLLEMFYRRVEHCVNKNYKET